MDSAERFEVVWPLAPRAGHTSTPANRIGALEGLTVGLLWNHLFRGQEVFEVLSAELEREHGVRVVPWERFGDFHNQGGEQVLEGLPAALASESVDAVIAGVGA